jgi:ribonuclease R
MAALAAKFRALRIARGALDLDVPEAAITVDTQGMPVDVCVRSRGVAECMIESFMLLANEAVAKHAKERGLPCLYRVHEPMEADKALALGVILHGLGLRLRGDRAGATPQVLQRVLRDAEALPEYPVVAQRILRAMQKARYDAEPLGHFGLAAADSCHFTAPIRRYPDLFVHRMLIAEITGGLRFCERVMSANAPALAAHASEKERNAMEAERAVEKLMMAQYMARHVGEEYDGLIVNLTEWGFYVALPNAVEGLVHVRTLPGFWTLNRERHCLMGEDASAQAYRLGQRVRVRVESADTGQGQIDFVLAQRVTERRSFRST